MLYARIAGHPYVFRAGASADRAAEATREADAIDTLFMTGYTPAEQSAVPQEAAEISLGCGNPTALAGLQPGEVVLDIGSGGGIDVFLAARKVGPAGKAIGEGQLG